MSLSDRFTETEVTEELPRLLVELDARRYRDPVQYAAELETVFADNWLHVARLDELPATGAIARTAAGRSIILSREGAAVHAMHNVCSHRGCEVVDATVSAAHLRCPFHGWMYGLDGRLTGVPGQHRFVDLDRDAARLPQLTVDTWGGSVWVRFSVAGPTLAEWLGPWAAEIERYEPAEQVVYGARADVVDVNWKTAVDSFNETYHVAFIHPETVGRLVHGKASTFRYAGSHSRMVIPVRQKLSQASADTADPRTTDTVGPTSPGRKDLLLEQSRDHVNYTIFPNLIANLLPTWGILIVFDPVAVDRTALRTWMIADPVTGERREHRLRAQWQEFCKVLDEDLATIARIAAGHRSPAFTTVRLGGEEERLVHFHQQVDAALGEAR